MNTADGGHTRVHNWVTDKNSAIKITASRFDAENDDFSSSLSNMIARDGQSTVTANIPFSGHKITGATAASALTEYATYQDVQKGRPSFVTVSEATAQNSISATGAIAITAYTTGMPVYWIPRFNNTGSATLNVSGVNTDAILSGGTAITSGMLLSSVPAMVISDGGDFHLMNPQRAPINSVPATALQADSVITAKIADDAITTAKIVDNSVTLAKLKHETVQGAVIYLGASGTPSYLAPGTSGQVMTSGGASANVSWTTNAGTTNGFAIAMAVAL